MSFEMSLLTSLGYGLELDECADTGSKDNLVYVSPKSGRAVCLDSGLPYHSKLLPLPSFLTKNPQKSQDLGKNLREIIDGMCLTRYFLEKFIFDQKHLPIPQSREYLFKYFQDIHASHV